MSESAMSKEFQQLVTEAVKKQQRPTAEVRMCVKSHEPVAQVRSITTSSFSFTPRDFSPHIATLIQQPRTITRKMASIVHSINFVRLHIKTVSTIIDF